MMTATETSTGTRLVSELKKIHEQWTVPATILMAIRGRLERLGGVKLEHRIGGAFPNGDMSVLLVGSAGSGKTRAMQSIYEGLGLDGYDPDTGEELGHFCESVGCVTTVGLFELLEELSQKILFADELDWGD